MITHVAIRIGSTKFIEETEKLNVVKDGMYLSAIRHRESAYADYYMVVTSENGEILLTDIVKAVDLIRNYDLPTLTVIEEV